MNEQRLYRRLVRRSSHRSRSLAVIVVLVLLILALAYAGVELVLAALGQPKLLVSPSDAVSAAEHPGPVSITIAIVALVLGIVLLIVGLAPGRRGRHELPDERMAVVIDDQVLAGAISKVVRHDAHVPDGRVSTAVSRRRGAVRIVPTSGSPVDQPVLTNAAERVVAALQPKPPVRISVAVSERGVVGS